MGVEGDYRVRKVRGERVLRMAVYRLGVSEDS